MNKYLISIKSIYKNIKYLQSSLEENKSLVKLRNTEIEKLALKLRNRASHIKFLNNELERTKLLKQNREKIIEKLKQKIDSFSRISKDFKNTLSKHNAQRLKFFNSKKLASKLISHSLNLDSVHNTDLLSEISYHNIPERIPLQSEQYTEKPVNLYSPPTYQFDKLDNGAKEMNLAMPATEWTRVQDEVFRQEGSNFAQYCFGGKLRLLPREVMIKEITKTSHFLYALREKVHKRKCIIIGNGPSLNKHDFSIMQGNFMIGSNYIFMNEKHMGYLPDIITATNFLVVEQRLSEFLSIPAPKIFPLYMYSIVGPQKNVFYANIHHFPEFSSNAELWGTTRHTVTYFNLQLAYFLGFKSTYLIGVDNSYKQKETIEGRIINQKEDDPNHFSPEYFKGLNWQSADSNAMEDVYGTAKFQFAKNARTISNAGIGGALELFDRVDYKSATKDLRKKINIKSIIALQTKKKPEKRVIVSINPDLLDYFGHYYRFDLKLLDCTQLKDVGFLSLSHKNVSYNLDAKFPRIIPCFTENSYEVGLRNIDSDSVEKKFEKELLQGINDVRNHCPDAIYYEFFMYCGSYQHLKAMYNILEKFTSSKIKIRFHLHVFYPSFEKTFNRDSETYRNNLFSEIIPNKDLIIYAGTHQFLAVLSKLPNVSNHNLRYLPCSSTTFSDDEQPFYLEMSKDTKENLSICYPGNLRPEKGLTITLDSLLAIKNNSYFENLKIFVRPSRNTGNIEIIDLYRCALGNRVNWIEDELSDSDFKELLASSDIIVVPYSDEAFALRPSGIFSDAILMNKPILAAKGTSMANFIETYGNGAVFDPSNIESFITKLKNIIDNPKRISLACDLARTTWRKENSWEKFYETLIR